MTRLYAKFQIMMGVHGKRHQRAIWKVCRALELA